MLLQAERAKEWEAKKRKHEEEVAEAFKEYEGRLKDVWVKMSGYIKINWIRRNKSSLPLFSQKSLEKQ